MLKRNLIALGIAGMALSLSACNPPKKTGNETVYEISPEQSIETAPSGDLKTRLFEQGVDFYARGNEPFWSLDIDFEGSFKFQTLDGFSMTTPPVVELNPQDLHITRYSVEVEAGELVITITHNNCEDNMSGEIFTNQVEVKTRKPEETTYTAYTGCGRYVPHPHLQNTWAITSIGGKKLDAGKLPKGLPTIELSLKEYIIGGHDGCNQIGGSFSTKGNRIHFGNLISTKMYCENMGAAEQTGALLSGQQYEYRLVENELLFLKEGKEVMSLKRVN
jgi:heat shock protein HslJ